MALKRVSPKGLIEICNDSSHSSITRNVVSVTLPKIDDIDCVQKERGKCELFFTNFAAFLVVLHMSR